MTTKKEFADWLKQLSSSIEKGDSLGGTIIYNAIGLSEDEIEAVSLVRCGNSEGQGGVQFEEAIHTKGLIKEFIHTDEDMFKIMSRY